MLGKWQVTSNYVGSKELYAVYRLKDAAKTDHSGNREFATRYSEDKQEQMAIADKLNQELA